MKATCTQEYIGEALAKASRLTGAHTTLPVLAGIYMEAKGNTVLVRATNLDVGVEISVPAKIEKEGSVVVPSAVITGVVQALRDETVVFEEAGENLLVSSEKSSTVIKALPKDEFPTLPRVENATHLNVGSQEVTDGFRSVAYAASQSTVKPELASVLVYGAHDTLYFVATDSFRLAEKKVVVKGLKETSHILIPSKNILDMVKVFDGIETELTVEFNENQISFSTTGLYVTSRLIDSTFPDYKQILPKDSVTTAVVLKTDFVEILRKSNLFAGKFNQINFSVIPSEKNFTVTSQSSDIGENTDMFDATLEGENIESNFNYRYILDAMQSIQSDSVEIKFSGVGKPMVLRGVGDQTFLYLVMPMNR